MHACLFQSTINYLNNKNGTHNDIHILIIQITNIRIQFYFLLKIFIINNFFIR